MSLMGKVSFDKERCDKYFNSLIEQRLSPSFSVAVAVNGTKEYCFAGGRQNFEQDSMAVSETTRYNIASVTKPFTASLVMKLVEDGLVAFNDTVKRFIPEYPFEDTTIFNLLTHTSGYGMANYPTYNNEKSGHHELFQRLYKITDREFLPIGETNAYWSFNYVILTDIIERITGMELNEFAKKTLFDPIGMENTTYELNSLSEKDLVRPWNSIVDVIADGIVFENVTGDSGLYTTASDIVKFGSMLLNDGVYNGKRIFASATVERMLSESTGGKFNLTPTFWYRGETNLQNCFGDINSSKTVGHTGMTGCMMFIDRTYNMTAAFLSNCICFHDDWTNYKKACSVLTSSISTF